MIWEALLTLMRRIIFHKQHVVQSMFILTHRGQSLLWAGFCHVKDLTVSIDYRKWNRT